MAVKTANSSFLDSVWMRLLALVVAGAGIALFAVSNQDMLAGLVGGASGESPAYRRCLDERLAAVDRVAAEAGYTAKQKELAGIRAAETCRNEAGQ